MKCETLFEWGLELTRKSNSGKKADFKFKLTGISTAKSIPHQRYVFCLPLVWLVSATSVTRSMSQMRSCGQLWQWRRRLASRAARGMSVDEHPSLLHRPQNIMSETATERTSASLSFQFL